MSKPFVEYVRFPISRDCEAIVSFHGGPVTQEGISLLQKTLELMKDCYPKAEEPKPFDFDSSRPSTEANGVMGESIPQ